MSKDLIIVESPTKARTIKGILGGEYEVTSSRGHIIDLPGADMGIDIENGFKPKYLPIKGKGKIIKELKSASKNSNKVLIATDPDREGEAIAYHIQSVIEKDAMRVLFYEVTKEAVIKALANPGEIDMFKVDAQIARRILDRLVGYSISPLLWRVFKRPNLSAGRVQSVALRLLCERESKVRDFVPSEYWNLTVRLKKDGQEFSAALLGEKPKTEDETNKILGEISGARFSVEKFEAGKKEKRPLPPYTTSTLQQDASAYLHMGTARTMKIAQQLFEGLNIEGKAVGLITYMRTDSTRISRGKIDEARTFIRKVYGGEFVPERPNVYKEKKGGTGCP